MALATAVGKVHIWEEDAQSESKGDFMSLLSSPLRAVSSRVPSLMPRSASEASLALPPESEDTVSQVSSASEPSCPPRSPPSSPDTVRSRTSAAYSAVLGRASQLLPAGLSRRRSSALAVPVPAPLLQVEVRRLGGGVSQLEVAADVSLESLLAAAARLTSASSATLFEIEVEELRGEAGLRELLRSTATQLAHSKRRNWALLDGVNWMFLPESVSREVRGRGFLAWLDRHVLPHLQADEAADPAAAHSVRVFVDLLGDRRVPLRLARDAPLQRLSAAVAARAGVPAARQRLVLVERAPLGAAGRAFWAAARALYLWLLVLARYAGIALGLLDPLADAPVSLRLLTQSGRSVRLDVTRDLTLHQLAELAQAQYGEELDLGALVLTGAGGGAGPHARREPTARQFASDDERPRRAGSMKRVASLPSKALFAESARFWALGADGRA